MSDTLPLIPVAFSSPPLSIPQTISFYNVWFFGLTDRPHSADNTAVFSSKCTKKRKKTHVIEKKKAPPLSGSYGTTFVYNLNDMNGL